MTSNADNESGSAITIGKSAWVGLATQIAEHLFAGQGEPPQELRQFGAYLRQMRYRRGVSLVDLAGAAHLPYDRLAMLEQGMLKPSEIDSHSWMRLMRLLEGKEPILAAQERQPEVAATVGQPMNPDEAWDSDEEDAPSPEAPPAVAAAAEPRTGPRIGIARIKVIGVGGGGSNAVARMYRQRIPGVEYAVVNTDTQHLKLIEVPVKLRIGDKLTRGLGVGGNPEVGREAALESRAELEELVKDADMVFIACGMGGGTGTGAAPVIAEIAKASGALTIAAVTKPFAFEGRRRTRQAEEGIVRMRPNADTLIIIPNDRLSAVSDDRMTAENAFRLADDVLRQGAQSIAELVTVPGEINLDFADVKAIMQGSGPAWMAIGHGRGENRAVDAAKAAMASPLLDIPTEGATRVLLNIAGGTDMTLHEVHRAADYVSKQVDPEANIIFGMVTDTRMGDEIRVTVIATGLRDNEALFNEAIAEIMGAPAAARAQDLEEPAPPTAEQEEPSEEGSGFMRFFGFGRRKPKNQD